MEFVYVIKRSDLFPRRYPHGLELLDSGAMAGVVKRIRKHGFFVERRHAELDSSLKQVIPYCVMLRGDEIFLMRRLAAGGEARLHGKRSVGVGGHINPIDERSDGGADGVDGVDGVDGADGADGVDEERPANDVIAEGLRREIAEELHVEGDWRALPVGLLNDDSTDVGSVHVGLVAIVLASGEVSVRETDVLDGSFVPIVALRQMLANERDTFETWSALVLDQLDALLPPHSSP